MHVNPALGGGLQGTPGNARVVPDIAELQIAARVFGVRAQTAAATSSASTSYYEQPISDGDLTTPSIVFFDGDIVTVKLATTTS